MKGFQGRPSLQSTTASRGTPKQGPRSSPPPTMSSSPRGSTPRSAQQAPSSLHSPFLQGPSFNDSSLNSPFLQGPSLNEIENCLTGLSAEEMEQVGDHHFGHKTNKVSDNSVKKNQYHTDFCTNPSPIATQTIFSPGARGCAKRLAGENISAG